MSALTRNLVARATLYRVLYLIQRHVGAAIFIVRAAEEGSGEGNVQDAGVAPKPPSKAEGEYQPLPIDSRKRTRRKLFNSKRTQTPLTIVNDT